MWFGLKIDRVFNGRVGLADKELKSEVKGKTRADLILVNEQFFVQKRGIHSSGQHGKRSDNRINPICIEGARIGPPQPNHQNFCT